MKILVTIVLTTAAIAAIVFGYVRSGSFDVAADQPHSPLVTWLAQTTRERSIAKRLQGIEVPDLGDAAMIASGANEYAQMCAGCHLGPGVVDNEFRRGLNPAAPELAKASPGAGAAAAARQFWIVKHGISMTAMPAWGATHDDPTLWSIVAFLQRLPTLSAGQYAEMTANSESAHDEHAHEHDETAHP